MRTSLHSIMKAGIFQYARTPRLDWVADQLGMVTLAGSQVRRGGVPTSTARQPLCQVRANLIASAARSCNAPTSRRSGGLGARRMRSAG